MTDAELKRGALPRKQRHEPITKSHPVAKRGKICNHWKARENMWAVESVEKHVTSGKREKICNQWKAQENM